MPKILGGLAEHLAPLYSWLQFMPPPHSPHPTWLPDVSICSKNLYHTAKMVQVAEGCSLGLQILQSSICGTCWTQELDRWSPHHFPSPPWMEIRSVFWYENVYTNKLSISFFFLSVTLPRTRCCSLSTQLLQGHHESLRGPSSPIDPIQFQGIFCDVLENLFVGVFVCLFVLQ